MRRAEARSNIFTLDNGPLCVACQDCGHRALVETKALLAKSRSYNMEELKFFRFKCTQCGSRAVDRLIPLNQAEAYRWAKGELDYTW